MGGDDDRCTMGLPIEERAFTQSISGPKHFFDHGSGRAGAAAHPRFTTPADDQIEGIRGITFPKNYRAFVVFGDRVILEETVKSASWEEGKEGMRFEERGVDGAVAAISVRRRIERRGRPSAFFSKTNVWPRHYHISL